MSKEQLPVIEVAAHPTNDPLNLADTNGDYAVSVVVQKRGIFGLGRPVYFGEYQPGSILKKGLVVRNLKNPTKMLYLGPPQIIDHPIKVVLVKPVYFEE